MTTLLGRRAAPSTQQAGADRGTRRAGRPARRARRPRGRPRRRASAPTPTGLDADPQRLDQIEARRAVLTALVRKYGDGPSADVDGVLRLGAAAPRPGWPTLDVSDEALAALAARRDEAAAEAAELGRPSCPGSAATRRPSGWRDAVTAELAGLAMPRARCDRCHGRAPPVTGGAPACGSTASRRRRRPDGADDVEILLQPHPDAPALPLGPRRVRRRAVAGDARARGVPGRHRPGADDGLRRGRRRGRRPRRGRGRPAAGPAGAASHQVLVVTHLAQVAAYADRHIVVDKRVERAGGRRGVTASDVRRRHRRRPGRRAGPDAGRQRLATTAREHACRTARRRGGASRRGPTPPKARRKPVKSRHPDRVAQRRRPQSGGSMGSHEAGTLRRRRATACPASAASLGSTAAPPASSAG